MSRDSTKYIELCHAINIQIPKNPEYIPWAYKLLSTLWGLAFGGAYIRRAFCISICVSKR